ncbi:DnaB-like helicase N-terminal domain-containing protein [Pimelobacter simplex]|uniref:DnaB-like helicase N-terminal domain-containing protein n=1 Tax=Nocardioides simplex TaxID=2045 RepID=UPI00366BD32F
MPLPEQRRTADAVLVADYLIRTGDIQRIGGATYLHDLMQACAIPANAGHYATIVRDTARLHVVATIACLLLHGARLEHKPTPPASASTSPRTAPSSAPPSTTSSATPPTSPSSTPSAKRSPCSAPTPTTATRSPASCDSSAPDQPTRAPASSPSTTSPSRPRPAPAATPSGPSRRSA